MILSKLANLRKSIMNNNTSSAYSANRSARTAHTYNDNTSSSGHGTRSETRLQKVSVGTTNSNTRSNMSSSNRLIGSKRSC